MEIIKSRDNTKIKAFSKLITDKKARKSEKKFVIEGEKVLLEAHEKGAKIDTVIFCETFKNYDKFLHIDANFLMVSESVFSKITDTKNPQGVVFSCFLPEFLDFDLKKCEKVLILDKVSDPGNLGTIIRTAVSFKIDAIVLLNDCVDRFSPKVIRSTMGAIFSIPIIEMGVDEFFESIKIPVYATNLSDESKSISEISLEKCAVVIGNESKGVSDYVISRSDESIIIPISGIESLNAAVASSILMWEMTK